MKRTIKTLIAASVLALGLANALQAHASVVIAGTRIIYDAKDNEQTIKLTNEGKSPALTQVWLDKGDPKAAPAAIDVPFTVTPPFARIDPGKGQTLRILYTGEPLPRDKESIFWLNVLEVPPKPAADEASTNRLQMAFRTRVKMFFRPVGLKGHADDAPAQITWRIAQTGTHAALEAHNPTPYHVSFSTLELVGGGKTAKFEEGGMVGPGDTQVFPLSGEVLAGANATVRYHAINDYGAPVEGEAPLNAAQQK
ncbi:periplasmic pilin chaperone [Paraburkholderia ribeironis]|uniref:Periplasmic pilin chaperone n=1 Tax=Paraburkholderia ribeironis TaxID=1247936 RepID=A0A1N7RKS8_9BURK|nr:fimbria/pilus periplasmic chaperone [Paraburkholderia ribeironis]SIT35711.1 periplasmic pilin chaperone [Paraburkholderia ribeironis]